MTPQVSYYCPRCGALAALERDAYLADKSVTPDPLEGWEYATPGEGFEDADGVRLTCGEHTDPGEVAPAATSNGPGAVETPCGTTFYLNFVRFENGEEVEASPESNPVRLSDGRRAEGPQAPGAAESSNTDGGPEGS